MKSIKDALLTVAGTDKNGHKRNWTAATGAAAALRQNGKDAIPGAFLAIILSFLYGACCAESIIADDCVRERKDKVNKKKLLEESIGKRIKSKYKMKKKTSNKDDSASNSSKHIEKRF